MLNFTKGVVAVLLLASIQGTVQALLKTAKTPKVKKFDYTPKLPKNMCTQCNVNLKTISAEDGSFLQPLQIFNIWDNPEVGCLKKLKEYVDLNPEDTETANAYGGYILSKDRTGLDYQRLERVVYTFCELCCDCIDILSPKDVPKLDVARPNCGLHYLYDASSRGIFPNMKYQDYKTGVISQPEGYIGEDMEIWLACVQKVKKGRFQVRSAVGLAGYHDKRRKLRSTHTQPMSTVIDEEEMLANPELSKQSNRKMLQAVIDCSDTAAVDAAVTRIQADLQALTKQLGCVSKNSYTKCHQMEYAQGRVCGADTDAQCLGKNW